MNEPIIPADLWEEIREFFRTHENGSVVIHQHQWAIRKVVLQETVHTPVVQQRDVRRRPVCVTREETAL